MRLIFIRHGEPNYQLDCLTETGKLQAQAAAERLKEENIDVIYASTMGRATETASYTAKLLDKEIIPVDFIREARCINREAKDTKYVGNIENISHTVISENGDIFDENWLDTVPYEQTLLLQSAPIVLNGIDDFLLELGYKHEGKYFRCIKENDDTVAVFCHANSSRIAISRIFGVPFPFVAATAEPQFTAISVLDFYNNSGELFLPKIEIFNDSRHIKNIENT